MDEINKIRKAHLVNGQSINGIAREFRRSWDTVNQIVKASREDLERRGKRKRKHMIITPEVIAAIEGFLNEETEVQIFFGLSAP